MLNKTIITTISILALVFAGFAQGAGSGEGTGDGDQNQIQTWEQKQDAIKQCAGEQVQVKEQIREMEQQKQDESDAQKKAELQNQINKSEQELTQLQAKYAKMLQEQTANKYEFKDANGDGVNDNVSEPNDPNEKAWKYENGYGYGYGFVDADGDGINDNYVDADGDGVCDINKEMKQTRNQAREQVRGKSQHGEHKAEMERKQLRGDK